MFDVIIPIYRISKPFLTRCLESVFDQTLEDYTVYVCDGTPVEHQDYDAQAFVESYGFNYFRQDPSHPLVSGARNQAVALGSNPYLAFLDGDDWWYDAYLREVKEEIEASSEQVAIWSCPLDCHVPIISQFSGEPFMVKGLYGYWPQDMPFLENYPDYAYYYLFGHPPAPTGTIIRREAYESVGGYDERLAMGEDTELLMRIIGDPRKVPVEERRHYRVLEMIVGFHYVGEENTCSGGIQTGANEVAAREGKDIKAILDGNMELFMEKHPRPTLEDLPDGVIDILPDFAETFKGVMRDKAMNPLNI
jgi:glycosyltransferase involved in cell wall biosynthesis|tara:strand:- start:7299 stop:8216 length:918 start_codon:yes stop_codon:yes gene_type:complete